MRKESFNEDFNITWLIFILFLNWTKYIFAIFAILNSNSINACMTISRKLWNTVKKLFSIQRWDKANYFTKAELINDRATDTPFVSILRLSPKLREVASSRRCWSKELCLEGLQSSFDQEMAGAKAPKTPSLDLSLQRAFVRNRNKYASGRLAFPLTLSLLFCLRELELLASKELWFLN